MTDPHPDGSGSTSMQLDHNMQEATTEVADAYVLHGSASSTVETIALKHGDAFMVTDARGDLPTSEQETGFFWHGMRFLRSCDLFLEGRPLIALSNSISDEEGSCQIDLSNPYLALKGEAPLVQGTVHIRRVLRVQGNQLTQVLLMTSFDPRQLSLTLGLKTGADFRDIFEVRGLRREKRGHVQAREIEQHAAVFTYRGLDDILRETRVECDPPADRVLNGGLFWNFPLAQGQTVVLRLTITLSEHGENAGLDPYVVTNNAETPPPIGLPAIRTDNVFFNRMLERGLHDLSMMTTQTSDGLIPYGGIPWYACPFGRDSLITSLEFLPWLPEIARGTLTFLAKHQGRRVDEFTEEEPGRILHEFRRGELANCREIPFIPYYGTIDANPLFLITLGAYVRWTDDMKFLRALWPNAQAAANWMIEYGDRDGDTFLEYAKFSSKGLISQGWKDSWDAISYRDGRLAEPPIALCEVQGYAYAAYREMDYLARRLGDTDAADQWRARGQAIQRNFQRKFWWPEEDVYYLALDGEKQPCEVVSSNAGQCLWSGIAPNEHAQPMISRLLRDDMYSEWGIRTVSSKAKRYNPMSYHNGTVWPHDTALVGAGFARYGRKTEASKLLGNLYGLSLYFGGARLPELFCGFARRSGYGPTRYPVACSPQSWAAGAPFLLLQSVLGLEPDAERERLTLRRPHLPDWLEWTDMGGLKLAGRSSHLRFTRSGEATLVTFTHDNDIDVHVLPG